MKQQTNSITVLEDRLMILMKWFGISIEEIATTMAFLENHKELQLKVYNWMLDQRDCHGTVATQDIFGIMTGRIQPNSHSEDNTDRDSH